MLRRLIVILSILMMTPAALMAQDDFVVFVSDDETFSIEHPEGWVISDLVAEGAAITATNSPRLVDQLNSAIIDDFQSGEQALMLFFIPTDLFSSTGVPFKQDVTPEEFIAAIRDLVMSSDDGSLTFNEPEVVFFDERPIGIIQFSDSEAVADGYYLAWDSDGIVVIALVIAYRDELEDFEGVAFDMLASFQLMISAEDLNP